MYRLYANASALRCYAALSKQSARDENMLQVYAEAQLEAGWRVPSMPKLRHVDIVAASSTPAHASRSRLAHKQQCGICTLGKLTRIGARPLSVQRAAAVQCTSHSSLGAPIATGLGLLHPVISGGCRNRGAAERRGRTAESHERGHSPGVDPTTTHSQKTVNQPPHPPFIYTTLTLHGTFYVQKKVH